MGSHIGGGEKSGIWHLSRCHPSRKWLARVHHVLVFCLLLAAKFDAPYINLSTNVCLVSATDVMEHFAFPGNKDFAADDQGAFHVLFMKGLLCLFIVCETVFTIGKSRTISNANDTQAQQVAPNPRGGRFSTEILWSENTDLKFNASNEEEDGSNKQRNRKNITQWISNVKVILRANWSDFGWLAGN